MPEPSKETMEQIGRLCAAWAYLENNTDILLWHTIGANERLGLIISSKMDISQRWGLILQYGQEIDMTELRAINKRLVSITRDRNIIVHGLVHASASQNATQILSTGEIKITQFARPPCWTVFRWADAGKNFPISTLAVVTVVENIQKVGSQIYAFNRTHGYKPLSEPPDHVEADWPKPLE